MFKFLLIVQALIAASLVSVILMQRSEGGGLGVGGSSSGFMTARGAADFLTRSTAILGTLFICMSIALAAVASLSHKTQTVDTSLVGQAPPTAPTVPGTAVPPKQGETPPAQQAPANKDQAPAVPLAQ